MNRAGIQNTKDSHITATICLSRHNLISIGDLYTKEIKKLKVIIIILIMPPKKAEEEDVFEQIKKKNASQTGAG